MPRKWVGLELPLIGGEQPDGQPGHIEPGHVAVLKNGLLRGQGIVEQAPDWLRGAVATNPAASEVHGVCGIFPFVQQGGASSDSAGVAFALDGTANIVYLYQLGEAVDILRRLEAFTGWTTSDPPWMTGVEVFGKFYFVPYGREQASLRKGLHVFDPAGAGVVTNPTYDVGGGAAALRFRGVGLHRGATLFGWGYLSNSTPDSPHTLRYARYGAPDTWVPDTTRQTAGFFNVGTLELPIVACATSGIYTIIGKATEIFRWDGDFSAEFYTPKIGERHGPVSTVGMVSIGDAAVWIALAGPVISLNGNPVELLGVDRVARRFLSYHDLTTCWGAHDPANHRVVWGMRRRYDEDGEAVSSRYLTELFWWDYERNQFGIQNPPAPLFSVGAIRGPGTTLVGPTGVVSNIAASGVGATIATITWTPGDPSPDVTFKVEFRPTGTSPWVDGGTTPAATYTRQLSGLVPGTQYDVRVTQIRNGQSSAPTQALALFTTAATPPTPAPAVAEIGYTGEFDDSKSPLILQEMQGTWTPFLADPTVVVALYRGSTNNFSIATRVRESEPWRGRAVDPQFQAHGAVRYYWLRTEDLGGSGAASAAQECDPFPITIGYA